MYLAQPALGDDQLGISLKKTFKKVGRVATAPVRVAGKGVKAVGKGFKKTVRKTVRISKKVGIAIAKYNPVTLSLELAAAAAFAPVRFAFYRSLGNPRAVALARARGRRSPNAADKSEAIQWGYRKIKKKFPLKLGNLTVLALQHTKGVHLAGDGTLGALGVDDYVAIATAAAGLITAMATLAHKQAATEPSDRGERVAPAGEEPPSDAEEQIDVVETADVEPSADGSTQGALGAVDGMFVATNLIAALTITGVGLWIALGD